MGIQVALLDFLSVKFFSLQFSIMCHYGKKAESCM